jgi:hypothetical protein
MTNLARSLAVLGVVAAASLAPLRAQAAQCSTNSTAGKWAYTYTGTIFTPTGALPAASVGHFKQDSDGNLSGGQARSVAGQSGLEEISGTVTVNDDCTGTATVNVSVNGQLQRTAELAVVYDSSGNHMRAIFQSLTLPNGANVPVVLTIDANRVTTRN